MTDQEVIDYVDKMLLAQKKLVGDLEEALRIFRSENRDAGSVKAVAATDLFLGQIGIEPRLQMPMAALCGPLVDNKNGNLKPFHEAHQQAYAAGAMEVLMQCQPERQTKDIAGLISRATGGEMTADQLIEIRKNLRRGRARSEARKAYGLTVKHLRELLSPRPSDACEAVVLQFVSDFATPGKKG